MSEFDPFAAVLGFHRKFCPHLIGPEPSSPSGDAADLRLALLREEFGELEAAIEVGSPTGLADALADLLYVTYGLAITYGIDIRPVFEEVHRTNMLKDGGATRADGKILKPEGWQPPDIAGVLRGIGR